MEIIVTDKSDKIDSVTDLIGDNFVELARLLRELHDEDPETFLPVVEKLGLKPRKAYYLIKIDRTFHSFPIPPERLRRIGWTKLQLIAPHVTPETWVELIELAETRTVHQLEAILRGEEVEEKEHCVLLYFNELQYEVFRRAVLAHGGLDIKGTLKLREEALTAALSKVLAVNDNN
jgi:hypothetical protein